MDDDKRRRKQLTPMSGELGAPADWVTPSPAPEKRPRARKEKTPPVTRWQVLIAGLKRIAIVLIILVALVMGVAVLMVQFTDMEGSRALTLAFFGCGVFIALGGFLTGTAGPSRDWMSEGGYDAEYRARAVNSSIVYGAFGVALIVVGAVLDATL